MFESVARLESVSRAAIEVNRSQPAVTQALAKLEQLLEADLIERRPSGSYLTDFGRILLLRTQRLLTLIEQALAGNTYSEGARPWPLVAKITSTQLRCLIWLAEGRSTVAEVTPRTLHRAVRELEPIIGRRLTRQGAQGTSLNPAGLELARQARLALKEIEYASEEIKAARGYAQVTITIGAMPQCAAMALATAVDEFLRRQPCAQIRVAHGPYDLLLNDLRSGKIDILFGVLRKPSWATDVVEEALFDAPYAVIARKGHPLSRKRTIKLDDLAAYEWILPQAGTPRRRAFERLFEGASSLPRFSIETSRSDLQATLIAASDRITMMSEPEALRLCSGGALVVVDYKPSVQRGRDGFAVRADWHPTAGNQLFLDVMRQQAAAFSRKDDHAPRARLLGRR